MKRSSAVMSGLLEQLDRVLGTVKDRQARLVLAARRHGAVAEYLAVALVVRAEQCGSEVVAAAVPLAALGIDVHFHWAIPVCAGSRLGARPVTTRLSNVAHSSSPTACR